MTVTSDGRLFFGVKPVSANALAAVMKSVPRHRDAYVYVKADARASFGYVKAALKAAHANYFETAVLLTAQSQASNEEAIAPPYGLEVRLGVPSSPTTFIQLRGAGGTAPQVKINDREILWKGVRSALAETLEGQQNKFVTLEAEDDLPSMHLVEVVDLCHALGATTALIIE